MKIKIIFFLGFIFLGFEIFASNQSEKIFNNFVIKTDIGVQLSGIKKEDFISSNISPLSRVIVFKDISKSFSLGAGYQGQYFYYIEDDFKHKYFFLFGQINYRMNIGEKKEEKIFNGISVSIGSGYFYNYLYDQPNICALFGISKKIQLNNKICFSLNLSSIVGWDIYQGDEDIIPSLSLGFSKSF